MDRPKSHRHRKSASVNRKPAIGLINRVNPDDGKKGNLDYNHMDVRSHEATLLDTSGIIFPEGHEVTGVVTERQSDVKASGVTEG